MWPPSTQLWLHRTCMTPVIIDVNVATHGCLACLFSNYNHTPWHPLTVAIHRYPFAILPCDVAAEHDSHESSQWWAPDLRLQRCAQCRIGSPRVSRGLCRHSSVLKPLEKRLLDRESIQGCISFGCGQANILMSGTWLVSSGMFSTAVSLLGFGSPQGDNKECNLGKSWKTTGCYASGFDCVRWIT